MTADVMMCPACGASAPQATEDLAYRNEGPYAHRIFAGLKIRGCARCGSAWVTNPPSNPDLGEYYGNAENYSAGRMEFVDKDVWPIWDARPVSLIMLARLVAQFEKDDYFLDVGPGNGAALSLAPLLLPSPRVGCIEYSRRSIAFFHRHQPGLTVWTSTGELIQSRGEQSVKMIYSGHCLEHFRPADIRGELAQYYRAIKPGGVLAVEVPFAHASRVSSTSKHTPHLLFFTDDGLKAAVEAAGFKVAFLFAAVGRTTGAHAMIERTYPTPSPKLAGADFASKIGAFNVSDFISLDPKAILGTTRAGVIKCIAIRA